MSLSKHDIELAYQLFLDRQPSAKEAERMLANQTSLKSLRRAFLNSPEFQKKAEGGFDDKTESADSATLIHLHVPKTAGSSLSRILAREAAQEARLTVGDHNLDQLLSMSPARKRQLRLIFGHLSHGIARSLPQRCRYISVLREPGPRLFSFYRYVGRTDHHPLYKEVAGQRMSFGTFLEYTKNHSEFRVEVDNGQVRRLSGNMEPRGLGRERQLLRRALHHVLAPNFTYGLTEHFGSFQKRLVKQGILSATRPIRENAAPDPGNLMAELDALTDQQRNIFNAYTAWDSQLYTICHQVYFSNRTVKELLP